MTFRLSFLMFLATCSSAFAEDSLYAAWCSDTAGQIALSRKSIELIDDDSCPVKNPPVRTGVELRFQCLNDTAKTVRHWQLKLVGDTLTVTEDGADTAYKRCD